jgi:hypothetical protein
MQNRAIQARFFPGTGCVNMWFFFCRSVRWIVTQAGTVNGTVTGTVGSTVARHEIETVGKTSR